MHTNDAGRLRSSLTRQDVISRFIKRFEPDPLILGAWLGGSDATGRADDLSDVDIGLIVEDCQVEHGAEVFDGFVEELGLAVRYRMPWPTWHGFHQAFYQLSQAPEHLMVDWVIVERSQANPWLEVERHGMARVLFDKAGLIRPGHVDQEAIARAIEAKAQDLRRRFLLFRHLPAKLAVRQRRTGGVPVQPGDAPANGLPLDAVHFYHGMVIRPLVDMLRIVYTPLKHDFGMRYLADDLPRTEYEALIQLCYPTSHEVIPACVDRASDMFDRAWAQWQAGRTAG